MDVEDELNRYKDTVLVTFVGVHLHYFQKVILFRERMVEDVNHQITSALRFPICTHRLLPVANEIVDHADSFSWGYGGSGPSQLAAALLYQVLWDSIGIQRSQVKLLVQRIHHAYKDEVIARMTQTADFTLTDEMVMDWLINYASRPDIVERLAAEDDLGEILASAQVRAKAIIEYRSRVLKGGFSESE